MFNNPYGNGPRSTPTLDGDLVYALGGQGNLVCARVANGEVVWRKSLKRDLGGVMMSGWGYSESPLVDGDQVVCTPGGDQGAVAALDKKTGEVLWRSKEFTDRASYSSLVISEAGGVRQYVQMTGESVAGVAARDGRLVWRFERPSRVAAVPTPVISQDHVYVTSGYGAGCALLKLTGTGNGQVQCEEVYDNKLVSNHHGGVVLVKGHIYGHSGTRGWICQDFLSGKLVWRSNKLGKGSLTCADGYLYCYDEDDGTVALVEASPNGWKESGRFTIPESSKRPRPRMRPRSNFWTHPVVANGRLYVRDQELIFCYDVSARSR
jgi:outer membrane protein assembly factor BamB